MGRTLMGGVPRGPLLLEIMFLTTEMIEIVKMERTLAEQKVNLNKTVVAKTPSHKSSAMPAATAPQKNTLNGSTHCPLHEALAFFRRSKRVSP
jgi:hypothetical protein